MKKLNKIIFLFSAFFILFANLGFSKSDYYDRGLKYPRVGNTTTLLPNGNILVVGGIRDNGSMASTPEIYIPSKGHFDDITSFSISRSSHTATLLPNGYVLIYGGNDSSKNSSAYWYIYNPQANSISNYYIGSDYARAGHTATLLTQGPNKGKILICGGSKYASGNPGVVNTGCFLLKLNSDYTAVSGPESLPGTENGALRAGHTATLLSNGNVFISGGLRGELNYEGPAVYMPGNETYDAWENKVIHNDDPLKIARTDHAAITMNDGRVMIIGGYNYNYKPNTSESTPFDISSNEDWYNSPNDGYSVRGRHAPGPHGFLGDVEFFDQNGARASVITGGDTGLPYRVSKAAGVLSPDGHIYLHGGRGNIPVTLGANIEVVFNEGSVLKPSGYGDPDNYSYSSNININTSHATAPLPKTVLSTKVSGKFINADAYVPPADQKTFIAISEGDETNGGLRVSFVHPNPGINGFASKEDIRLWLDGLPVGRYIEAHKNLTNPSLESGQIKYPSVPVYDLDGSYTVYPARPDDMVPTSVSYGYPYIEMYDVGASGNVKNMGESPLTNSRYDNCPGRADSDGSEPITCHGYLPSFTLQGIEITVPPYFDGATLAGEIHIDMGSISFEASGKYVQTGRFNGSRMEEEWTAKLIKSSYLGTSDPSVSGASYSPTPYWLKLSTKTYSGLHPTCVRDAEGAKSCTLSLPSIDIGKFTFEFINNSTHAIHWQDLQNAIGSIDLQKVSGIITFKPSQINLEGIAYDAGASTIVVRDMLFSNTLTYNPASASWDTGVGIGGFYEYNAPGFDEHEIDGHTVTPYQTALMDHSMIIDPAGTPIVVGGRSCDGTLSDGIYNSTCKRNITGPNDFYTENPGVHVHHDLTSHGHVTLKNNLNGMLDSKRFWDSTVEIDKMKSPRQGHTTSSLPNGNLLVCGGSDGNKTLDTCELYDIKEKKWSYTGSMSTPRSGHTATLLPNGKVLVAGGTDGYNFINTSEIYNPKTGKFDDVLKSMQTARRNHTATLLPNGNVFVVGGSSETYNEVFITTRAAWVKRYSGSKTGKLTSHEAVLLKDGKVAVIGGLESATPNAKYYIFNPVNASESTPSPTGGNELHWKLPGVSGCGGAAFGIYKHKVVMDLNGNVWLIGGTTGNSYSSYVIVYTYNSSTGKLGDTTNCSSGSGLLVGNLIDGVVGHSAMIAPDNIITVFGGNTQHRTLGQQHTINADQRYISATVKSGSSGNGGDDDDDDDGGGDGKQGSSNKNKYEKYNVLKNLRTNHTMILDAEGYYYIIGGDNGKGKVYDSVERVYFTVPPDTAKVSSEASPRRPLITNQADENVQPGSNLTLLSTNTVNHFHGYTEAGDGTAVHHNTPRLLLQAVDIPSGFLIDISTEAYVNHDWNLMMSSITVKLPGFTGTNGSGNVNTELPWGYYYALESVNGQFTNFKRIQVGENWEIPDITGEIVPSSALSTYGQHPVIDLQDPNNPPSASNYAIYYSSIVWTWPHIDYVNYPYINGYEVYSATFTDASLGRVELNTAHDPVIISTALQPNYPAKIKVVPYNIWTEGENFRESAIYYTLAETPVLSIDAASGNYATLNWTSNNFDGTCYEVDWCHTTNQTENCFLPDSTSRTSSGTFRSTSFDNLSCYSTTTFNTTELDGITGYKFRVRAINGTNPSNWAAHHNASGYKTAYSNIVDTITVKNIEPETIIGTPSTNTITWSWPAVSGYYVEYIVKGYDPITGDMYPLIAADTNTLTTSEARVSFTQTWGRDGPVTPNKPFSIAVQPWMKDMNNNVYVGAISTSVVVYTMASPPTYVSINPATVIKSTQTNEKVQAIIVDWGDAGNSSDTEYSIELSTQPDFSVIAYSTTAVHDTNGITSDELEINTYYYGRVTSINAANKPSADITYATAPVCTFTNPPAEVEISSNNTAGIGIKWDYNDNPEIYDADGNQIGTIYNVMISTDSSFPEGATFFDSTFENEYLFTGLLTSLRYYVSVNSQNQAGHTVEMEATITTMSVTGPEGTWPGSVIGMTDPVNGKDIYGNLLTGRFVSLYVPPAAYTEPTEIAISSVTYNVCSSYGSDIGYVIAAQVFTNNPDPMLPVDFTIGYFDTEANVIEQNQDSIVLARYNAVTNSCLPLSTTINTNTKRITASVNTFDWDTSYQRGTVLQVIKYLAPSTLTDVQIYPNPFYPNRGDGYVQIEPVPANTKLTLYTLSGAKVWEGTSGRSSVITWDGKNKSGVRVASGIYLGVLEAPSGKKKIKIAVEK